MVQHVRTAKRPPAGILCGLLLFILLASTVTSEDVETAQVSTTTHTTTRSVRVPRSLFSNLFGAVVSSIGNHVKRQRRLEAAKSAEAAATSAAAAASVASSRIDIDQAVDSIQKKQNYTLFGSVFTEVSQDDFKLVSTTTTSEAPPEVVANSEHQNYANETYSVASSKGVFDDIANGITSLFGGAGPAVDAGPENVNLVPNNCWYRGEKYECALSLTCAMQGRKSLDLCNGGLIWTCCVDRDKIDKIDPDLGALSDAKCGEIYTGETNSRGFPHDDRQSRIVGGSNTFFGQHPWQVRHYYLPTFLL